MSERRRGAFITLEGGEGGGKSTQTRALVSRLDRAGVRTVQTREPGGSPAAEAIRTALLAGLFETLGPRSEALLFSAARIDHLETRIKPALEGGAWVVSDRFHDSTRAYQGASDTVERTFLERLETITLAGLRPDLTLILDLPAHEGLLRASARREAGTAADRFERQTLAFHESLRRAFLDIAEREPDRCVVVDASQSPEDVEQAIWDAVIHRLDVPVAGRSVS